MRGCLRAFVSRLRNNHFTGKAMIRLVCFSDTHGMHRDLASPEGDVLVCAGDVSGRGRLHEVVDFLTWFRRQPHPKKVLVAGNHDFLFEREPAIVRVLCRDYGITYLEDSGCEIGGLRFWGSPVTPRFLDWAFNRDRGTDIRRHWDRIPEHTDVLITHGPPAGILDEVPGRGAQGCSDLLACVQRIRPRVHISGHLHEGAGYCRDERWGTLFVNASVLDETYRLVNAPTVIDVDETARVIS